MPTKQQLFTASPGETEEFPAGKASILWLASPIIISSAALIIRLAYLFIPSSRIHAFTLDGPPLGLEAANIAYSIAAHQGFSSPFLSFSGPTGPTAWLTPVFPYLLSIPVMIFGAHSFGALAAILVLNQIFSAATCWPVFHIGRSLVGPGLGALAAWLWAFFPVAIWAPYVAVWYTSLSALLIAVIVAATLRVRDSQNPATWTGYGLLWGFELLTNAAFASPMPFVLIWLAYELRKAKRDWIRLPLFAALAAVLVCMPWTIRNYFALHAFVPLRSNFGLELWRFNNPVYPSHPTNSAAELNKYVQMGEIAYFREKKHHALEFIRAHPRQFLSATKRRALFFWIVGWRDGFLFALSNMALTALVIVGLCFLYLSTRSAFWLFLLFPAIFPLPYYATLSSILYRHAIDPVLIVIAAFAIHRALNGSTRLRQTAKFRMTHGTGQNLK